MSEFESGSTPNDPRIAPETVFTGDEETLARGRLQNHVAGAVEHTLCVVDAANPAQALLLQLEHARVLAAVGNIERTRFHFQNLIYQIEFRGETSDIGRDLIEEAASVSQILQTKTIWFANVAKAAYEAGYLDFSDQALTGARLTLEELEAREGSGEEGEYSVWGKAPSLPELTHPAEIFADLQQFKEARWVLNHSVDDPESSYYYVAMRAGQTMADFYTGVDRGAFNNTMSNMVEFMEKAYQGVLRKFWLGESRFLDRRKLASIIELSREYGLELDHDELLKQARNCAEASPDAQTKISEYCFLARQYYKAGNPDQAHGLLQTAITIGARQLLAEPEQQMHAPTAFTEIAAAYALVDDFQGSNEVAKEAELPLDLWAQVLQTQMRRANETKDVGHLQEILPQLGQLLSEALQTSLRNGTELHTVNSGIIETALIHGKHGGHVAMSTLLELVISANQMQDPISDAEALQKHTIIPGANPDDISKIADYLLEAGQTEAALNSIQYMNLTARCRLLINLIKHTANPAHYQSLNELEALDRLIRRYIP